MGKGIENLASVVGFTVAGGASFYLWAPLLGFDNGLAKVLVSLPIGALGALASDMQVSNKQKTAEVTAASIAALMGAQFAANYFLRPYLPGDQVMRALLLGPAAGVVLYGIDVIV